jgi:hypothetical protein
MARRYGYGFKVMLFKIVDQSPLSVQTQGFCGSARGVVTVIALKLEPMPGYTRA